ncbi:MAG: S-layer homology domain-containing protein [Clostridia bacterium]|nr:S-layer homology domain-containing protein [Clostridia bacterium]
MKKIFAFVAAAVLTVNTTAFARITHESGVYKEDFEGYGDIDEAMSDKTLFDGYTKKKPELIDFNGSKCIAISSAANTDNMLMINKEIFDNDINNISFQIAAEAAPKTNWKSGTGVYLSYTNESGADVNVPIYDFAYNLVRHEKDGKEAALMHNYKGGTVLSSSIRTVKAQRDGKYYFDVVYTVNSNKFSRSFETAEDGIIIPVFRSTLGNCKLFIDDITVSGEKYVRSSIKETGRRDVSVFPELNVRFDGEFDETTLTAENISIGTIQAQNLTRLDDGTYTFRPAQPLEKNTEYTITLGDVRDKKGSAVVNIPCTFTTKNTAVIIDDSNVLNTSASETESIIKVTADYEDGAMTDHTAETCELEGGQISPFDNEGSRLVVTADFRPVDSTVYMENTGVKTEEFIADFDEAAQLIYVSGKTEYGREDEILAVSVFDSSGGLDYLNMIKTDAGGYFGFAVKPNSVSGIYSVCVKSLSESFSQDTNVRLASDAKDFLKIVNAKNADDTVNAIEKYSELLSIEFEPYKQVDDLTFIAKGLSEGVQENGEYTSVDDVANDIKRLSVIYCMKGSKTAGSMFDTYRDMLTDAGDAAYGEWDLLTAPQRQETIEYVYKENITGCSSFKKELYVQTLLTRAAYTNKYIDIKNIIEKYPELLSLDLSLYTEKDKPSSVAKGLLGKRRTKSEFAQDFERLVDAAGTQAHSGGNGGSGGSGGGRGSSGGGGRSFPSNVAMPAQAPKPSVPEPAVETVDFSDIDTVPWAKDSIYGLCKKGILSGYGDATFRPDNAITREEFVAMIVKSLGADDNSKCDFDDVSENSWYYKYIASACSRGIVNGMSNGSFGVGMNITREDAAVIISRILSSNSGGAHEKSFVDEDDISDYAAESVRILTDSGIIDGNPDGRFVPKGSLTRAQAAKILWKAIELKK